MNRARYNITVIIWVLLLAELLVWAIMVSLWWFVLRDAAGFRFNHPEFLRVLLIGPILCVILVLHALWRNGAISRFATSTTAAYSFPGISTGRLVLRFLLLRHGLGLIIVALADPQYGSRPQEVKSSGVDVVIAVDVSNSMLAEDLKPDRMESARRALSRLIDQLHGDRLGLIVFAGEAFVQLPITTDRSAARLFLAGVNTNAVPTQGTAIGEAIELARESFDAERPGGKAIIVITDGENHEDDAEGAAREAAKAGIVVHTIGMGTPQGAPLPVRRNGQLTGFRKDASGTTIVSRLNEEMLIRIAAAGNGTYVRATERSTGVEELVDDLRAMEGSETGTWQYTSYDAQFQYPLGLGLLLILFSLAVPGSGSIRTRLSYT